MIINYLKIALRNLRRYKGHSFINIFGLSVGIAAAILIFLYARNELSYERFHQQADDISIVYKQRQTALGTRILFDTWIPLANELQQDYPEIRQAVRMFTRSRWVIQGGRKFEEQVTYADPAVFDVFSFPLVKGTREEALRDRNSIVISEAVARKYFGTDDPLGKTLSVNYRQEYIIRGVMADLPPNTTIPVDLLAHFDSIIDPDDPELANNWDGAFLETYLLLESGTSRENLEAKFPALVNKLWGEDGPNGAKNHQLRLLPLADIYDHQTNARQYAYILLLVALAILLIASINFMNLATARSLDRAREIGMRKVLGAVRRQLIGQFLGESLLMSMIALLLGIMLAEVIRPLFNDFFELQLTLNYLDNWLALFGLLGLGLGVGLLAGSYPALVLSSFRPVESLKGRRKSDHSGLRLRNVLVIAQFAFSVILILGTVIIWQQIEFMKHRELNFQGDNVVAIPTSISDFQDREAAGQRLQALTDELRQTAGISSVASSSGVPGAYINMNTFARPEGWEREEPLRIRVAVTDAHYFDTYEIPFLEGRNFSRDFPADADESIIINQAAVRAMGWQHAVGKIVYRGDTPFTVIGVVRDFNWESLQNEVAPVIHHYRPTESGAHNYISVAMAAGSNVTTMLALLREKWQALDPQRDFEYFFVNERFAGLYRAEERIGTISAAFAIVAIVIACLGLFALASFTVTQRTKEIGIRKTLGASVGGILYLIARSFLALVLSALLIAGPLAYYLMNTWLASYPFRVNIGWEVFAVTTLLTLLIAFLAIGWQTVRAALSDPVKSLRYE